MRLLRPVPFVVLGSLAMFPASPPRSTGAEQSTAVEKSSSGVGLILAKTEGERRVRRPPPSNVLTLAAPLIIKVDRTNGGSPDFFMGYEDIPAGKGIARHYHPHYDEILFVHRGSGLVTLGTRESTVTEGATIYIPPNTRVSLKNTGTEPLSVLFFFPQPAMADYFREASVPEGERAVPFSPEEFAAFRARHRAHVIFEER